MLNSWMQLHNVMDSTSSDGGGGGAPASSTPAPAAPAADSAPSAPVATPAGGEGAAPGGAPEPKPAAAEDAGSLEQVFSDLALEDGGPGEGAEPPAKPATPAAPIPPPVAPAQPVAPVQPAAPVAQPAQPAQPVAAKPDAPAQPSQPATPTPTQEELQAQFTANRVKALATIAKHYAVPEERVADLVTSPEKVLPELLAQVHVNAVEQVWNHLQQHLPAMMERYQQVSSSRNAAIDAFYKEWPELRGETHSPIVARTLVAYRQANPQATAENVIREGGLAALIALKLPIPERLLGKGANNLALPDARPAGAPPVHASVAARPAPGAPESNPFTVIANEDIAER